MVKSASHIWHFSVTSESRRSNLFKNYIKSEDVVVKCLLVSNATYGWEHRNTFLTFQQWFYWQKSWKQEVLRYSFSFLYMQSCLDAIRSIVSSSPEAKKSLISIGVWSFQSDLVCAELFSLRERFLMTGRGLPLYYQKNILLQ